MKHMITVSHAEHSELERFLELEWTIEDKEHYGDVEWQDIPFAFKAVEDNTVVGAALGRMQSGVVMIDDVIVAHTHRGKGIGKLLVERIENLCQENKGHKVWGYTGKNWDSVQFYTSLGYQVTGELPNHFHRKDFVIISKDLT